MDNYQERYNRQLILDGFGQKAQRLLSEARVLLIGAGGLGCPALQYLAAAGVGSIGIVDHDLVSLSNLHRQVLFTTDDIGMRKAVVAARRLEAINPDITINAYPFQLDPLNAVGLISGYDFVVDGTDNFSTRYLVNDVCVLLGKPLVYGAVSGYEGQVAVFNAVLPGQDPSLNTNYRDLFPVQPDESAFPNCAEAGVLGVLPGIIGTMQATELIKLVTGIGEPLVNRLLTYDALGQDIFTVGFKPLPHGAYQIPGTAEAIAATDYGDGCRVPVPDLTVEAVEEIDLMRLREIARQPGAAIIDVREPGETPALSGFEYTQIPLSVFPSFAPDIEGDPVILFCQSGSRSLRAAAILKAAAAKKIFSLKGGVAGQGRS
ncbi:MAG: molybdopterin biosynthesis protein [Chitinophagaceae bacterium]|nr:MAG: molybdopterin biosynthesis protein [Chitinophagaceae bacterium]